MPAGGQNPYASLGTGSLGAHSGDVAKMRCALYIQSAASPLTVYSPLFQGCPHLNLLVVESSAAMWWKNVSSGGSGSCFGLHEYGM